MYAIKAMTRNGQACVKAEYEGWQVSLAFDDSCGVMSECFRADIRVFDPCGADVTAKCYGTTGVIIASAENFITAWEWITSPDRPHISISH